MCNTHGAILIRAWSKEIEPSRQSSTHHSLIVSSPIDKKGSEFMRRSMRWEAPSMPTAAYDPGLLREQERPLVLRKNWFLDQEIPAGGFVRIQDSSQVWEEQVHETRIITTPDKGFDYMPGPRTRMDNYQRGMELSNKTGVLGKPRASADYNYLERDKTNKRV